jgi:hypothetical protein
MLRGQNATDVREEGEDEDVDEKPKVKPESRKKR